MKSPASQPSFITDRPVAVLMVFVAAVVFGYFSLRRLPVMLMPEMSYPSLTVRTQYPGAAPEEVENDISRRIEEQLGVVGGLNEISSISRAGVSDVVLEFVWGTSMVDAIQNTLEKLDTVTLPRGAEKPLLLHYDPSLDPVMELSLSSKDQKVFLPEEKAEEEADARRLRRIAELQVKRALEPIKGVAAARVRGGLEEEVHVLLDADKLERINLSISQVLNRLRAENINAAGGRIREGSAEYMIRTINEFQNLEEIANTVVYRHEGREIRLNDLGSVVYGQRDREMLTRTNGRESVQIDIYKESDSNMVQIGKRIKAAVGTISGSSRSTLAGKLFQEEDVILEVVADRSVFIDNSIREVKSTAFAGGALAIVVLLLFLKDFRVTLIVAVSIPISIFATFAPLNLLGVSLNIMSLGGLAMGIGMLVDSSIVVLESIHRCREEGDTLRIAAIRGTREVRGAVIASTLTSVCVFFPMVFVEGLAGQVFSDLGLTVVTSLLASLIVAVLLIPMLASREGVSLRIAPNQNWHVLGSYDGRLRIQSFLIRVLCPILLFGGILCAVQVGYFYWKGGLKGSFFAKEFKGMEQVWALLRWWMIFCALPLLVALFKVRRRSDQFQGECLGEIWHSYRDFIQGMRGRYWGLILLIPYGLVRLFFAVILELLALNILWLLGLGAYLFARIKRIRSLLDRFLPSHQEKEPPEEKGFYPALAHWVLKRPGWMVGLSVACLVMTVYVGSQLETELLPEVHQAEFTVEAALPVGTPLNQTVVLFEDAESKILSRKGELGITTLLVMYGFDSSSMKSSQEGEHSAKFKVLLEASDHPAMSEERALREIRQIFENVPDLTLRVTRPVLFSSQKPVVIQINGEDLAELKAFSDEATEVLSQSTELADVEPTLRSGAPEVQIIYDRMQMIRHGLNIEAVANLVRDMVRGAEATRLNRRDRRVPIVVRLSESDRERVADVGHLIVNPGAEMPVPLNSIADLVVGEGPSEIRRIDGKRVALVQANIGGRSLGASVQSAQELLETQMEWPVYMDFFITGQNREWERSRASLYLALGLSLFLVYVIMASQFESFVQPLIIMVSIPLAFAGTVIGLKLTGINLSVVVFLGLIMLAGIVVNNAIVLVDYTNQLRNRGLDLKSALVKASSVRMRPILMTTSTTVLGLLPMALGLGEGAEIRTPMAVAVIFGLISSTLLTLIIIPTFYYLFERGMEILLVKHSESA